MVITPTVAVKMKYEWMGNPPGHVISLPTLWANQFIVEGRAVPFTPEPGISKDFVPRYDASEDKDSKKTVDIVVPRRRGRPRKEDKI